MQEQLTVRKSGSRPAQVQPLAHLQHNVLPAHVRMLQNAVHTKPAGLLRIPVLTLQTLAMTTSPAQRVLYFELKV